MLWSRRQLLSALLLVPVTWTGRSFLACAADEAPRESRAIFDEGLNWASKESARLVCERIVRAGFNVFIPCVWHGRGTIWPSQLAPWDSAAESVPGFDPLAHLLEVARPLGLEVHPWFTVMRRERDFLPGFYDAESIPETFDVHRPAFRDFIVELILEVVRRYPIQGINLDYLRAGGICTSRYCVDAYARATGRSLLADVAGAYPEEFLLWQEQAVEDILRRVVRQVRQLRPDLVVSVDAVPGHWADKTQGRNSIKWVEGGLADVVYLMHYEAEPDWTALERLRTTTSRPYALAMLCGNYEEPKTVGGAVTARDADLVADLLGKARTFDRGAGNGLGLYLYSMLSEAQIALLRRTVFSRSVSPRWVKPQPAKLAPPLLQLDK